MSIADSTETSVLALIFNATIWTGIAQNHATPDASVAIALATADPGDTATMTTSEVAASGGYTGYARQNVNRNSGGWTVTGTSPTQAQLTANVDFPATNGASTTITHWQVGKIGGGASQAYFNGAISPTIAIAAGGVIPRLQATTSYCSLD